MISQTHGCGGIRCIFYKGLVWRFPDFLDSLPHSLKGGDKLKQTENLGSSVKKELKALKSKRKSNLCLKDHAIGEISLHIKAGIFYYGGSKIAQYFQLQNPHNWHKKQENGTGTHTQKQSFWKLSNSPEGLISSCKTLGKSQYQTIPERLKGRG